MTNEVLNKEKSIRKTKERTSFDKNYREEDKMTKKRGNRAVNENLGENNKIAKTRNAKPERTRENKNKVLNESVNREEKSNERIARNSSKKENIVNKERMARENLKRNNSKNEKLSKDVSNKEISKKSCRNNSYDGARHLDNDRANKKNEESLLTFHRFSIFVWIVWLIPNILGMMMGMGH